MTVLGAETLEDRLTELVKPLIESMGLTLWGLKFTGGQSAALKIYIDREDGVTADECGQVVDMLSPALDTADLIAPAYTLEVSSPGMDRILFTEEQMLKYLGQDVKLELHMAVEGLRKVTACLAGISDGIITLTQKDGAPLEIAFSNVKQARLVPVFPEKGQKGPKSAS